MRLQTTSLTKYILLGAAFALISVEGWANDGLRVRDLTLNGWEIVEKSSETLRKPGLPPYETATRVIEVTTYTLAKGKRRYVCSIAYDRQQDQFKESCRTGK